MNPSIRRVLAEARALREAAAPGGKVHRIKGNLCTGAGGFQACSAAAPKAASKPFSVDDVKRAMAMAKNHGEPEKLATFIGHIFVGQQRVKQHAAISGHALAPAFREKDRVASAETAKRIGKALVRLGHAARQPKIAGNPSLLAKIRGAETRLNARYTQHKDRSGASSYFDTSWMK